MEQSGDWFYFLADGLDAAGTPGLGDSVTCYYAGSVGAWAETISGIVP